MADNDIAIKIQNLSKCYQIYEKPIDRLKQMTFGSKKQFFREFWAIRDTTLEIRKGETVGIVGRNGSGKSTLLQMICGTLNQTSGTIEVNGRISALLELGSGFNPEFTGKENVYLNATILGLSTDEIDKRYEEILSFAEIGDFIDQPVKTYSSGMLMRLGFSVAINVDPDILVVDEALSVGDELFQRKCFARIENIASKGATILFVSHSSAQIANLCNRAILIDQGKISAVGKPRDIINEYHKILYAPVDVDSSQKNQIGNISFQSEVFDSDALSSDQDEFFDENLSPTSTVEYNSLGAHIYDPQINNLNGQRVNILISGNIYKYSYRVRFEIDANDVNFGMLIKTYSGIELGGAKSDYGVGSSPLFIKKGCDVTVSFSFRATLNQGLYFMNSGVIANVDGELLYIHRVLDLACFRILQTENSLSTGLIDFACVPEITIS